MEIKLPVVDLHCDLLHYLAHHPNASMHNSDDIGVAIPHLKNGNVAIQVCAVYTAVKEDSAIDARNQGEIFQKLLSDPYFQSARTKEESKNILKNSGTGIILSIESASGLCAENAPLASCFENLEKLIDIAGHILYISFTHHTENRFGGGNYSDNVGLKKDGEALLDYLSTKGIAVDLAHSSDALAEQIFHYVDQHNLDIPIIASHSNFRPLCSHVRNLPDEFVQEIIRRKGLIGMNFLRAYIHDSKPEMLLDHFLYGIEKMKAIDNICFGADYFATKGFPDPSRHPLFFKEHENASCFPRIITQLKDRGLNQTTLEKIAYQNYLDFIDRVW